MTGNIRQSAKERATIIIVIGAVYICLTMGLRQSFGLYLSPYTDELGLIDVEWFSFAIGLQNILWGLASPIFGAFADRHGPVRAVSIGGALYAGGLFVMAAAGSSGEVIIGQGLVGIGIAGAGFSVILGVAGKVAKPEKRSMTLAVVSAAGSLGQFALVPLAQKLLTVFGARESLYMLAVLALLMVVLAPLLRMPPSAPLSAKQQSGGALGCALNVRSYVLLTVGFFVCGFQVVFVATHLPNYAADNNISSSAAAWALSMVGLFNIIGTLTCGWLGDRFAKKNVLVIFYLLRSVVIALFLIVPLTATSLIVFGALIGLLWLGTVPLTSGLISVFFGVRHLSMLYGVTFLMHQVGSFMGAWLGGWLYGIYQNYDIMWGLSIFLGIVAALLHAPIVERADEKFTQRFA